MPSATDKTTSSASSATGSLPPDGTALEVAQTFWEYTAAQYAAYLNQLEVLEYIFEMTEKNTLDACKTLLAVDFA